MSTKHDMLFRSAVHVLGKKTCVFNNSFVFVSYESSSSSDEDSDDDPELEDNEECGLVLSLF